MNSYFFKSALLPTGWQSNVRVETQQDLFLSVTTDVTPQAQDQIYDVVIPQMPNVHSHVFQRAMAGLSEVRTNPNDDFWSWRDLMYRLANDIDAQQLYEVAKSCYSEMKQAGYVSVCEFHYLHRDKYDTNDYISHSKVILKAAAEAGLNITLLPVMYAYAGTERKPLSTQQKRFELSVDEYIDLFSQLQKELTMGQQLGICFHSLRAVVPEQMHQIIHQLPDHLPVHIHVAEQQAEIDTIEAHWGQRPVEFLFENFAVDHRWCLVHATHLNSKEVELIAASGAVVGLCPLTEANLGDGIFPMPEYIKLGGEIAIGSDSNIEIKPAEELKMFEYSQRLTQQKRNVCCDLNQPSVGTWLWLHAVAGGAQVSAQAVHGIKAGEKAAVIVLDGKNQMEAENILNAWVFSDFVDSRAVDL